MQENKKKDGTETETRQLPDSNLSESPSKQTTSDFDMDKADLLSSIFICALGLFILITGIHISFFTNNGTDVWYYSPGLFPVFIGTVLVLLSIIMFVSKYKHGARICIVGMKSMLKAINSKASLRLFVSIALLAAYVFLAIGRLPFVVATFIYLAVTMMVFRKDNYAIWKILVISACATGMIYLFFGVIAAVPLP